MKEMIKHGRILLAFCLLVVVFTVAANRAEASFSPNGKDCSELQFYQKDGTTACFGDFQEDVTVILYGRPTCYNCQTTMREIYLLANMGVSMKVVVLWCDKPGDEAKAVEELYGDRFQFTGYAIYQNQLTARALLSAVGESGNTLPFVTILDADHQIYDGWSGLDKSRLRSGIISNQKTEHKVNLEENFPDAAFRECISDWFDKDKSGDLDIDEIVNAQYIDISSQDDLVSVRGIEKLSMLSSVYIGFNKNLKEMDLSKNLAITNLFVYNNGLTDLKLGNNNSLLQLQCSSNQLTQLDLSGCQNLWVLNCSDNALTSLDVSNNQKLRKLNCLRNNITKLDLRQNETLKEIVRNGEKKDETAVFYTVDDEHEIKVDKNVVLIMADPSKGDCNGDGSMNRADRIQLARALANWEGYDLPGVDIADFNGDNVVNRADRIYLARALAGWDGYAIQQVDL